MAKVRRKRHLSYPRLKSLERDLAPVQTDWKYWAHHILHWYALLAVVIVILYIGYTGKNF